MRDLASAQMSGTAEEPSCGSAPKAAEVGSANPSAWSGPVSTPVKFFCLESGQTDHSARDPGPSLGP